MTNSSNQTNKIINVTLTGGILGLLADSPQNSLNAKIQKENANGWKVIQVIPADSGNLFLIIFRFVLLVCTLFFYTTANGYYVVMEKVQTEKQLDTEYLTVKDLKCSKCGKEFSSNMKGSFCDDCGNKL